MFHSSKHSKITLHKKLFAPVSITSARGSGSSTEPKATIPVLLPPEPDLEVKAQTEPQAQAQELGALAQSSNTTLATSKLDSAASLAAVPIPMPTANITLQPNHRSAEAQAIPSVVQPHSNSNNIQVLASAPPRSPFYSALASTSTGISSTQQMSTHTRNFSSTSASTTTSNFGSPPPSYTPFVTPLSPQAHGYRFGDGSAYVNTNGYGYWYRNENYTNASYNQHGYGSQYPSSYIPRSSNLQLPDLVDEVLRLRDRLNFLESGSLSNERGGNRGDGQIGSVGRNRGMLEEERKDEDDKKGENEGEEEIEGEKKRVKERWEEIEKFGLGYEDFLEEFYFDDDKKEVRLELNEESFSKQLVLELKFSVDNTCGDECRGKGNDGSNDGNGREPREETAALLPSVFVNEGSNTYLRAYSLSTPVFSSGLQSDTSFSPATPISSLHEKDSTKESQAPLPKSGCHYFITAGSIQNITVIYPATSLPDNMDALKGEKEIIRRVLEGWNRGVVDKYGIHPRKRTYAAIVYPEPQAPLPRKKLRIALSFTPIYPPASSTTSSNPIYQTPTNPEDIITDTNIYISTTNDSSFLRSESREVVDYTKYKVKYGNQEVHERHDGVLEVGRLRAALGCEVFKQEGDERENRRGDAGKRWKNGEAQLIWNGDGDDVLKWEDEKKNSESERGVQRLGDTKGDIEGGWI